MCIKLFYYLWLCSDSAKTQDLEEEQPSVDAELRKLLDKPGWYDTEKVKHHLFADAAWSNIFICVVQWHSYFMGLLYHWMMKLCVDGCKLIVWFS